MADANLRIVIDALNKASDDLKALEKQLKGVEKTSKDTGKATGNLDDQFKAFKNTALSVVAGLAGTYIALKKFYDFAKQGAELEYTADKFDRLADSIGTTADVLLTELRDATKGTRSDMELMASATDFVALGFAKTKDEAVRLATVAGALNMNMNQLVLTLANQTTMRFDQLGVAVEGFDERLQALKATGMDTNAAFKEAFLQQAEAQIGKVGNAADSTAGDFMRLEAALKNLVNAVKTELSEGLAPAIKESADLFTLYAERIAQEQAFDALQSKLKKAGISVQEFNKRFYDTQNLANWVVDIEGYNALLEDMQSALDAASGGVDMLSENLVEQSILMKQTRDATLSAREGVLAFGLASEQTAGMVDNFLEKAQIFKDDFGEAFDVAHLLEGQTGGVKMLINELGILGSKYTELKANLDEGLAEATLRLNVAIQTVYESVAGQLSTALDNANLSLEQLRAGKSAIDTVFGTNTRLELELGLKVDEWAKLLIEDPEGFVAQMSEIQATTLKFDADTQKAMQDIADLQAAKNALEADTKMKIKALINDTEILSWQPPDKYGTVIYTPQFGSHGIVGGDRAAGGEVKNAASGVAATLPHYWVGELGPEPFFPETNGRIVSNTQAMSALRSGAEGGGSSQPIVVNITTPVNLADRVWVERELAPYIRDALRKAGK